MNAKKALRVIVGVLIVVIVLPIVGAWLYQSFHGGATHGFMHGVKNLASDFMAQQDSRHPWWEGDAAGAMFWLIVVGVFVALALFYLVIKVVNGY